MMILRLNILENYFIVLKPIPVCSSAALSLHEREDEVPTTTAVVFSNSQSLSRRTRQLKGDNQFGIHGDGSFRAGSVDGG